jgi:hypothetical protein
MSENISKGKKIRIRKSSRNIQDDLDKTVMFENKDIEPILCNIKADFLDVIMPIVNKINKDQLELDKINKEYEEIQRNKKKLSR